MTQTYRKWYDRNTCRISSDPKCRFGYDVRIEKITLAEIMASDSHQLEIWKDVLTIMGNANQSHAYQVDAHNGARTAWFSSYHAARAWANSQFC